MAKLLTTLCLLLAGVVCAAAPDIADTRARLAQLGDPYLPPAARQRNTLPPAEGSVLRTLAVEKLRRRFDAADVGHTGTLTQAQARQAGLGFVADHFEQIDQRRQGRINFDDLRLYMRERGANL